MQGRAKWVVVVAMVLGAATIGCGKKKNADERAPAGGGPERAVMPPTGSASAPHGAPAPDAAWNAGAVAFKAAWVSEGEATKKSTPARLTGTFYVGPTAARLDLDVYPNSGGPLTLLRVHGDDSLWRVDASAKEVSRALSGDWIQDLVPIVIEADDVEDIVKGRCPFGSARPDDCTRVDDAELAGMPVQQWTYKHRTHWIAPRLRTALKLAYTPYRNNPGVQTVELRDVQDGAQDASLFKVPADYACNGGSFCDSVPR